MNIGFITPEYVLPDHFDGGLANYIYKVSHALTLQSHNVTVFVLSDQDRVWIDNQVKIIEVKRVKYPRFYFPGQLGKLFYSFLLALDQIHSSHRIAKFVWKQHRLEPFDILQTSSFKSPGYALKKNGIIPIVCRVSSYSPVVRSAYGRRCTIADYITDRLEIRQVIDADAAFAPSKFTISLFNRLEAFKPDLLPTPVDIIKTEFDNSKYEKNCSMFRYFLFFGTLSKIKGVDLIAEAIPTIIRSHPDIHFVFVGRDDGMPNGSKLIDNILRINQDYAEKIHYIPPVPKNQLYSIIAHAYAVLIPSRVDNYPNACLEAQMLGIPVIGSTESSLDEMIEDGKTGFLFENGNVKSLIFAMTQSLKLDEKEYKKFKKANIELSNRIFKEDRLGGLVEYYQHVILEFKDRML